MRGAAKLQGALPSVRAEGLLIPGQWDRGQAGQSGNPGSHRRAARRRSGREGPRRTNARTRHSMEGATPQARARCAHEARSKMATAPTRVPCLRMRKGPRPRERKSCDPGSGRPSGGRRTTFVIWCGRERESGGRASGEWARGAGRRVRGAGRLCAAPRATAALAGGARSPRRAGRAGEAA